MNVAIGKNSVSGKALVDVIEKIEALRAQKKQLGDDERVLMAGAKAAGFVPKFVNLAIKARAAKPHDFQDYEQTRDLYLNAIGMAETPPLFRQLEVLSTSSLAVDALVAKFQELVPRGGEFTFTPDASAQPIRIWRDTEGVAYHEIVAKQKPLQVDTKQTPRRVPEPVPNCTEDEAQELGTKAWAQNQPITTNPFPFGDKRRQFWDRGWRHASGGDGMGPQED